MIAKEMEELEGAFPLSSDSEKPKFSIKPRYMYRYEEVTIRGIQYLAKKSCKHCHGTGRACRLYDSRNKIWHNIYCSCLVEQEEEDATQEEG